MNGVVMVNDPRYKELMHYDISTNDNLTGRQKQELAQKKLSSYQYLLYCGMRVACRPTWPVHNITTIRNAAKHARLLAKDLDRISKQVGLDDMQRVKLAQDRITLVGTYLKTEANPNGSPSDWMGMK